MKVMNLRKVPLAGRVLIEASAGTGKTYTLSHLVLRLILTPQQGLGEAPLSIREVLVVTFTKAATQELRNRIRAILHDAKNHLSGNEEADDNLAGIVRDALDHADAETLVHRCNQAILDIDDAPVFTIHGFCQRMLNEYSFSMGLPVSATLVEDNRALLHEISLTLWRELLYPANRATTRLILSVFSSPDTLISALAGLLQGGVIDPLAAHARKDLEGTKDTLKGCYTKAAKIWREDQETLRGFFAEGIGRSYQKRWLSKWFEALDNYFSDSDGLYVNFEHSEKFCQSRLDEKLKTKAPKHDFFELLDSLQEVLIALKPLVMSSLRLELLEKLHACQEKEGIVFFDDLIRLLAEATQTTELCQSIATQYPVALIDEFQDTDMYQYRIFDRVYQQENTGLLMIGDPKQAIYSFRGADIYTYFLAGKNVDTYTLNTNHRTGPGLIDKVNALFSLQDDAFVLKEFPRYPEVKASENKSDKDGLINQGETRASFLTVLPLAEDDAGALSATEGKALAAERTADWISQKLTSGTRIKQRPLLPKDIAILVRSSSQAAIMKAALLEKGINSVFLSRESVLSTEEASALLVLVKAMLDPFDVQQLNTALGDRLIGMDAKKLMALNQDVAAFFRVQQVFIQAKTAWEQADFYRGFAVLVSHFNIAGKLLSVTGGERQLTNLQQLAEIFNSLDVSHLALTDQAAYFEAYCLDERNNHAAHKLRLETEADLVEIVTIHRSKGLEYPLVCCPFLFDPGKKEKSAPGIAYNHLTEQRELFWLADDEREEVQDAGRLAEDVRLLYVALTRAECHLMFCFGLIKGVEKTAIYHLLHHRDTSVSGMTQASIQGILAALEDADLSQGRQLQQLPDPSGTAMKPLARAAFVQSLFTPFIARSYSAMIRQDAEGDQEEALLLEKEDNTRLMQVIEEEAFQQNIFHFPKGSEAGNFLHLVLEDVNFQDLERSLPGVLQSHLDAFRFDRTLWQPVLESQLELVVTKPLMPAGCSLSMVRSHSLVKEMGFQVHAIETKASVLTAILADYRGQVSDIRLNPVKGQFKGFIDLIFCYEDKYYVVDYKSNFLGYRTEDYDREALNAAIIHHAYDLQFLIYQAALQRYLKTCLPDFDAERHLGGVFYLFLRGMNAFDDAGIFYTRPPAAIVDRVEALFEGTGEVISD